MEQIIVFLYDTEYCRHEADDPQEAVLFFHPSWVSDQQKLALCGQLMGVTHFCSAFFSAPSVLTLQSGKFVMKKFGRYVLSVGSDQCLSEWILKERFRMLQSSIELYYNNLDCIRTSVGNDHAAFKQRLSQILNLYIPILQNVVSSVGSVPSLIHAKGSSSVFLESMQLLEACSANDGVVGGVVLHNGRILASQLDARTNMLFTMTDPSRIKSSVGSISVPFHLPIGVQLCNIFIQGKLINELLKKPNEEISKSRRLIASTKQLASREMKKIFTLHEEEPWLGDTVDVVPSKEPLPPKMKQRRNSKQKTESNVLKERSKTYKANPNITVCSTPTVEKKLIHDEILSICSGKIEKKSQPVPDLVLDTINAKPIETVTPYNSFKRVCMDDQMVDLSHKAFPVPLRYYSFGLPKFRKAEPFKLLHKNKWHKTIADPLFPVFREDGVPVSKGLYNHCLDEHYKDYLTANLTIDSQEEFIRSKNIKVPEKERRGKVEEKVGKTVEEEKPPEKKMDQKLFRRSLTLPLKPMVLDSEPAPPPVTTKKKTLPPMTPTTPLMSKLSLLMIEEQELRDQKPPEPVNVSNRVAEEKSPKDNVEPVKEPSETVPCSLFVCGHRDMTLLLILKRDVEQNPDLVLFLWEAATMNLDRIEMLWERSMDHVPQPNGSSSYSFLSLNPEWGTVNKYGPWGSDELRVVGSLHQDLLQSANITELIIRNEDFVVYGYRCGDIEAYYQQGGCASVGLPTPADLMGVVTLKARRRLERDHGVVLL